MRKLKRILSIKLSDIYQQDRIKLIAINTLIISLALVVELVYQNKIAIFFIVGVYCISFLVSSDFNVRWIIPTALISFLFGLVFFLISCSSSSLFFQLLISVVFLTLIAILLSQQYDNNIILTVIGYYAYIVYVASLDSRLYGFNLKTSVTYSFALFAGAIFESIMVSLLLKNQERKFSHRSISLISALSKDIGEMLKSNQEDKTTFYRQLLANSEYLEAFAKNQRQIYGRFYSSCDRFYALFSIAFYDIKTSDKISDIKLNNTLLDFLYFLNSEVTEYLEYIKKQNYTSRYRYYTKINLHRYSNTCIMRLSNIDRKKFNYRRELYINHVYTLSKEIIALFDLSLEIELFHKQDISGKNLKREIVLYARKLYWRIRHSGAMDTKGSFAVFHALRVAIVIVVGEILLHYIKSYLIYWVFLITPFLLRDYARSIQERILGILIGSFIGTALGLFLFDTVHYITYGEKTIVLMILYPIIFVMFFINYSFYTALQILRSILQLNIIFGFDAPLITRFFSSIISVVVAYVLIVSTSWIRWRTIPRNFSEYRHAALLYLDTSSPATASMHRYNLIRRYLRLTNISNTVIKFGVKIKWLENKIFMRYIIGLFFLSSYRWIYNLSDEKFFANLRFKKHIEYLLSIKCESLFDNNQKLNPKTEVALAISRESVEESSISRKNFAEQYKYIDPRYVEAVLSFAYLDALKNLIRSISQIDDDRRQ